MAATRLRIVSHRTANTAWNELVEHPDGEIVTFKEHEAALTALEAEVELKTLKLMQINFILHGPHNFPSALQGRVNELESAGVKYDAVREYVKSLTGLSEAKVQELGGWPE